MIFFEWLLSVQCCIYLPKLSLLCSGLYFAFAAIDTSGETLWKMRNSGVSTILSIDCLITLMLLPVLMILVLSCLYEKLNWVVPVVGVHLNV